MQNDAETNRIVTEEPCNTKKIKETYETPEISAIEFDRGVDTVVDSNEAEWDT